MSEIAHSWYHRGEDAVNFHNGASMFKSQRAPAAYPLVLVECY